MREWRELTGGIGVPVIAQGKDFVIGFSPERLEQVLECYAHMTEVDLPEDDSFE